MEPEKLLDILPETKIGKKLQEEKEKRGKQPLLVERKSKTPVSMHAMELSLVFNTSAEERKQRWCRRYFRDDYYVEAAATTANAPDQPGLVREEDLNTLLICFLLLRHSRQKSGKYTFETTPYQITKFFGDETGGSQYADLKNSLGRLASNYITTNFWWDKLLGQRIVESNFHFLDSVDKGEQKALRITFGAKIAESLDKGYLKILEESDLKHIIKLRGHAKGLSLFLIKLLGRKAEQDLNLGTILKYLGVEDKYGKLPPKYFNLYVKRSIVPAVEKAAKAIGFISSYAKQRQQFHLRRVRKTEHIELAKREVSDEQMTRQKEEQPLLTQRRNEAFRRLTDIGVTSEITTKIFNEFTIDEIERQIEWIPYRRSNNPAAVFVSAIREHWGMPAEYEHRTEQEARSGRRVDR